MTNFSQSAVKSFRRCQKQYSFRRDYAPDGLEMHKKVPSIPLKRGGWLHELQQAHHEAWAGVEGADWEERHAQLTAEFDKLFEEEQEVLGDLPGECERLFRAYLRHYRGDYDQYRVAYVGNRPAVEFVVEVPLHRWVPQGTFKGRVDLLVEDLEYGGIWVWDAKWVKTVPAPDERMMSPQSLMYVWALRRLGIDVRGFVFNYGRTKPPAIPQVLKRGTLTVKKNLDTDYVTYLTAIKELHGDEWKYAVKHIYLPKLRELKNREVLWFRRERIPVEKERITRALGEFVTSARQIENRPKKSVPRTYEYNCKFTCAFHDLCVAEFQGLDIEPLIKKNFIFEEERYSDGEDSIVAGGSE